MLRLLGWALIRETELLALQLTLKGQEERLADLRQEVSRHEASIKLLVSENYRLKNTPLDAPLEAGSWGLSGGKVG